MVRPLPEELAYSTQRMQRPRESYPDKGGIFGQIARGESITVSSNANIKAYNIADAYLHAAGRCGRMGQPGLVTTLCSRDEEFVLARIANSLRLEWVAWEQGAERGGGDGGCDGAKSKTEGERGL